VAMEPPRTRLIVEGGRWPAEIWAAFAGSALAGVDEHDFPIPELDITVALVDVTRNCLPNLYTPPELIEPREYLAGTAPTEVCREPTGPPVTGVPAVLGLPLEVGQRLLEDKGFVVVVREEDSQLYPPGIITRQRPDVGGETRPEDGNAVVLWVAINARESAVVPDVLGLAWQQAVDQLEREGWVAAVTFGCGDSPCSPDAQPGTVAVQEPGPSATAPIHSLVTVRVVPDG